MENIDYTYDILKSVSHKYTQLELVFFSLVSVIRTRSRVCLDECKTALD